MTEAEIGEEKTKGRLEDLASDQSYLDKYLGIRVDIGDSQEIGTVIACGEALEEVQNSIEEDKKIEKPGDEYHIFYPQRNGQTARQVSSVFLTGKKFSNLEK